MKPILLALSCLAMGFGFGWFIRGEQVVVDQPSNTAATHSSSQSVLTQQEASELLHPDPEDYPPVQAPIKDFIQSFTQDRAQQQEGRGVGARFGNLLKAGEYSEAMSWYQEHIDIMPALKSQLLNYLDLLLSSRRDSEFTELSHLFLYTYYDDIDVLLKQAEFNRANGFYTEAVDVYQLAQTYAYSNRQLQQLYDSFNQLVYEIDSLYSQGEDWYELSNFYNHIESLGMLSPNFEYRQALAYIQNGDSYSAIQKLEQIQGDAHIGPKARQLLARLVPEGDGQNAKPRQGMNTVKLQKQGNQFLVNTTLNRHETATLLIDTGASVTTLSSSRFSAMSSSRSAIEVGTRLFQTANGVTRGTVYQVSEFQIGPYTLENIQIAVLDFSLSRDVDGLLGMNVLGKFRFQIDQDESLLYLSGK